ncbi:MAG: tetratricopeptide repeat protein, partial [Saprospiraceae bacterium]|nr:tetratricopeptide repeat protein [Saprospiraceae bacterium]
MFLFLGLSSLSYGQEGRVTEAEINVQKTFIEANREKILGNYEEAANLFREVLAENARNGAAAYELARVYDVLERNKEALESVKLAVSIEPLNSWYQTFLADLYEDGRQYGLAAEVYENLIQIYPDQHYYYYKQAFYLVKNQDVTKAIKVYNQLEEIIGITQDLTGKKFRLYLALGNTKKATGELKKLV